MPTYGQLLLLILPVFGLVLAGVVVRRLHWVEGVAETSLVRLVVKLFFPALIFQTIVGSSAMQVAGNVVFAPLMGFIYTALGIGVAYQAGRLLGLTPGAGLRSFALAAGMYNCGYVPLPIVGSMWGSEAQSIVLAHIVGVDAATWTVAVLVLSGLSLREGWRELINPNAITLVVALTINATGLRDQVPGVVMSLAASLGACAIPLGLVMIGIAIANYVDDLPALVAPKVALGSILVRLGVLPVLMLLLAKWVPATIELKRVLAIEAAMPSAVIPIVLARHYGGQPLMAVRVILASTVVGLFTAPLWIRAGLAWVGG